VVVAGSEVNDNTRQTKLSRTTVMNEATAMEDALG